MSGYDFPTDGRSDNPLDAVQAVADLQEWSFDRSHCDEIAIHAEGHWTSYRIEFSWVEQFEALHVGCRYDMKVPTARQTEAMRLIALANGEMFCGHFDLRVEQGFVEFRHALPLAGGMELGEGQVEYLVNAVLSSCERYYQALQQVVWTGCSAKAALDNVLFETVGEA